MKLSQFFTVVIMMLLVSCVVKEKSVAEPVINNFVPQDYWYSNDAEISSYTLKQARYGEIREGNAVLIFVTEPFSVKSNTKADNPNKNDVSVLKLNLTKKFNTGIYPYSLMTSTFFPYENGEHSLKVSFSSQEWCGNTYMELRNKEQFETQISSYFEGESIKDGLLPKAYLEDDIWSMIRLQPNALPLGATKMIPSLDYIRLQHKELKAYDCVLSSKKINETVTSYKITYPDLDRSLVIEYEVNFPYKIVSWEETRDSGWGKNKMKLVTSATLIKTIKTDYWNKNSNKDAVLRTQLGLE